MEGLWQIKIYVMPAAQNNHHFPTHFFCILKLIKGQSWTVSRLHSAHGLPFENSWPTDKLNRLQLWTGWVGLKKGYISMFTSATICASSSKQIETSFGHKSNKFNSEEKSHHFFGTDTHTQGTYVSNRCFPFCLKMMPVVDIHITFYLISLYIHLMSKFIHQIFLKNNQLRI